MLKNRYAKRYRSDSSKFVYPAEFVVRAFLGSYPGLSMPKGTRRYAGMKALDLGYGDGRNMPLLKNLGMRVHGVEISEDIHPVVAKRLRGYGMRATLKTGTSADIPYRTGFFDAVLACHSCYYIDKGQTFENNLSEIARVLVPGGYFIASLPMKGTYILNGARRSGKGLYRIEHDPYGLRRGTIFRVFSTKGEIKKSFQPYFEDLSIGSCDDDYWGIRQKVWIVACRRKS